jgi:hypothetical protein
LKRLSFLGLIEAPGRWDFRWLFVDTGRVCLDFHTNCLDHVVVQFYYPDNPLDGTSTLDAKGAPDCIVARNVARAGFAESAVIAVLENHVAGSI